MHFIKWLIFVQIGYRWGFIEQKEYKLVKLPANSISISHNLHMQFGLKTHCQKVPGPTLITVAVHIHVQQSPKARRKGGARGTCGHKETIELHFHCLQFWALVKHRVRVPLQVNNYWSFT